MSRYLVRLLSLFSSSLFIVFSSEVLPFCSLISDHLNVRRVCQRIIRTRRTETEIIPSACFPRICSTTQPFALCRPLICLCAASIKTKVNNTRSSSKWRPTARTVQMAISTVRMVTPRRVRTRPSSRLRRRVSDMFSLSLSLSVTQP